MSPLAAAICRGKGGRQLGALEVLQQASQSGGCLQTAAAG